MSILDAPQENLDPVIWDISKDTPQLHEDVTSEVVGRLHDWMASRGYTSNALRGLYLIGSEATLQYSPISDLDIDVLIDPELVGGDEGFEELVQLSVFSSELNGVPLGDTKHPVNYFFRDADVPLAEAEAIYDIFNFVWIQTPPELPPIFDPQDYFAEVIGYAKVVAEKVDTTLAETRQLLSDYFEFGEEEAIRQRIEQNVESLVDLLYVLRERRHKAFESQDIAIPYGFSRNWMPSNVVYKFLEKYEYIKILMELERLYSLGDSSVEPRDVRRVINSFLSREVQAQSVGAVVEQVLSEFELPQNWWEDDDLRSLVEELASLLGKSGSQIRNYIRTTFLAGVMDLISDTVIEWALDANWMESASWRRKVATYVASLSKLTPQAVLEIIRDHILEGSYTFAFKQAKKSLGYSVGPWAESLRISEKWYVYSSRSSTRAYARVTGS